MAHEKRITLTQRQPNPLFVAWLQEWLRHAEQKDSMRRVAFAKALDSLQRYPLVLQTGRDCCILDGFGSTICQMLDKQLAVHRANVKAPPPKPMIGSNDRENNNKQQEILQKVREEMVKASRKRNKPLQVVECTSKKQPTVADLWNKYDMQQPATNRAAEDAAEITPTTSPIVVDKNTFDIILLVDTQETAGKSKRSLDVTIQELERHRVRFEVRRLSIGDFLWICRRRSDPAAEYVLPHILERKRMDDLAGSIKDGRFHEQKFRLSDSGIANVVYMVESLGARANAHLGLPLDTLLQATTNTLVQNGFVVRFTESHVASMQYLAMMTELLVEMYQNTNLIVAKTTKSNSCPNNNAHRATDEPPPVPVLDYREFTANTTKMRNFRVRDMFVRQLLQLKTLSLDKALAIVGQYPTPSRLLRAYDACGDDAGAAERLLAPIRYGVAMKTIGPAISKVLYHLYNARQPL